MSERDRVYGRQWREVRALVLARDGGVCQLCRAKADAVDHIVPWRQGGAWYDPENLRAVCTPCNTRRARRANRPESAGKRRPSREW